MRAGAPGSASIASCASIRPRVPDYDPLTISDEDLKKLPPAERGAVYKARAAARAGGPPPPPAAATAAAAPTSAPPPPKAAAPAPAPAAGPAPAAAAAPAPKPAAAPPPPKEPEAPKLPTFAQRVLDAIDGS